jgi:hypothetical protein
MNVLLSFFQVWHPHFFALSNAKLFYTKETDQDNDDEIDEDLISQSGQVRQIRERLLLLNDKSIHNYLLGYDANISA